MRRTFDGVGLGGLMMPFPLSPRVVQAFVAGPALSGPFSFFLLLPLARCTKVAVPHLLLLMRGHHALAMYGSVLARLTATLPLLLSLLA